jgi:malonyl-CoA O-methyltransferase
LAQLAQVWYRLGEVNHADKAMKFLENLQNPSGGFFGSYGVGAEYFPCEEISWAVKYAIEAVQHQITAHFNQSVNDYRSDIAESDGRVQTVLKHLGNPNGKKVLDAGCGKGRYAAIIKKKFPLAEITAMDISKEMLKHVPPGIKKVKNGILNMPFQDEEFDTVICIEALEHVVQIEKGIKELSRVIAPGGRLVIIDKNKEKLGALKMPKWEKWFSPLELEKIMQRNRMQTTHEFVAYENHRKSDGLFVCWSGIKKPQPKY